MKPLSPREKESLEDACADEGCYGGGICAEAVGMGEEDEDEVANVFGDFSDEESSAKKEEVAVEIEDETNTNRARGIRMPGQPSRKEIEEHNLTHADYRDWCEECVKGKGRKDQHRRKDEDQETQEGSITTYAIDYMYLTENLELIDEKEA